MVRGELARGPRQVLKGGHGEGAPSAPQSAQAPFWPGADHHPGPASCTRRQTSPPITSCSKALSLSTSVIDPVWACTDARAHSKSALRLSRRIVRLRVRARAARWGLLQGREARWGTENTGRFTA